MAKSRDTFNKFENEKKKEKKKKDKVEKKEARKSSKGVDFESMIAYVDEDGNITSTPPDPTKRKQIDASEIQIGVPKQEQLEQVDPIRKGTVTFFNESKGYGFIRDQESQESIFVHAKGLIDAIRDRDKVTFEVEMGPKGPNAVRVKLA
jgi:cold shock CspA family protein